MEPGYVMDRMHGGALPESWIEGEPEKSFWTGLKTGGREKFGVRTFPVRKVRLPGVLRERQGREVLICAMIPLSWGDWGP
jgi:hypothetical protein